MPCKQLMPLSSKLICQLLFVVAALQLAYRVDAVWNGNLQFKADGTFKMVMFTDLHMAENNTAGAWDDAKDNKTMQVMEAVLSAEPDVDLVLLTGDMLSGWYWDGTPGWVEKHWPNVLSAIERHNLPYAYISGNHDSQANLDRRQLVQMNAGHPLSLTRLGPPELPGGSNYYLDICASTVSSSSSKKSGRSVVDEAGMYRGRRLVGKDMQQTPAKTVAATTATSSSRSSSSSSSSSSSECVPAARIWLFDTLNEAECGPREQGCCEKSVPQWLGQEAVPAGEASPLPGIAFTHIPLPEFMAAWRHEQSWGHKYEKVSCYPESGCLFPALKAAGVTAVYSGHDHDNNFYAMHHGIRLGYGAKTGYGSYGPAVGVQRGARVLVLRAGESAADSDTWLRFEDGSRQDQGPTWGKSLWQIVWPFQQHICNW